MSSRFGLRACGALLLLSFATACSPTGIAVGTAAVTTRSVLQERSTGDAVNDARIEVEVNAALLDKDHVLFGQVGTEVVEGRVLMVGDVQKREHRVVAAELAWGVAGVREVINEINVAESGGLQGFAEDVYISNQVVARLIAEKDVSSFNYNIETIDNVVHLIGLAQTRSELRRVASVAATTPGVERVVSHVLVIDDPRRTNASYVTTSASNF